tara:strand:- start:295 stop:513 length:219 start_codon:yes stop_codon:yes gene_type:complete
MPELISIEINELKIRYKYKSIKYLIVLFFKNEKFLDLINRITKEISIIKIFINDIFEPKIIDIGIIENSTKK